jgi:proprotein convertase subtilisin/kexin type 5
MSRCYPYVCNSNSITFTIGIYSITCLNTDAGAQKTLSALHGYLTCPNYIDFCTMSRKMCPNFCNQNGYCTNGICNCYTGYYGSTCNITTCTTGQYYSPLTLACVTNCPSGYYTNIYSKSCQPCQSPCSQCVGSPTACSGCATLNGVIQYFYNNACYSTCPAGTYATGALNCVLCNSGSQCLSCSYSPTNCTACQPGYYLSQPVSGSCISSCAGTGYNLQDEVNRVCVTQCPSNEIAPGNGSCVFCPAGSYQAGGNLCNATCSGGYYANTVLMACMSCDSSCKTCDGSFP